MILVTMMKKMYVWDESKASRGPQEVGSCIMHFVQHFVKSEKLIMYSDQCGGQNRNIKIAAICNYMVMSNTFSVKEIHHKCLVSGHSYLACDQDFGLIEQQKRFHKHIYIPHDWLDVIKNARKSNPFQVIEISKEHFKSSKQLEDNITNRKVNSDKSKVEWLKIQWIYFTSEKPYCMHYKYSNNDTFEFFEVDLKKRVTKEHQELDVLFPNGRTIDYAKLKDLKSLLPYIPPIHHEFYNNLRGSSQTVDYGLVEEWSDGDDTP